MKVLGIGLSKTATTSLHKALEHLGYKSGHMVSPLTFDNYDALSDVTVTVRYKELDKKYPGSKFILTIRADLEAWLDSCARHFPKSIALRSTNPEAIAEIRYVRETLYGGFDFDRELWRTAYGRHMEDVGSYFANRARDLLVIDICAGEGWEKLCPFLGRDIPAEPFPFDDASAWRTA
jgi:hypothetical protein